MATDIIARGLAVQRPPTYIFVENYSALPADPIANQMYYALNAEGTPWLPGDLGGEYHPAGPYYHDGVTWQYIENTMAATQEEVNAGIEPYKFVSPNTFENSTQLYELWLAIEAKNQDLELQIPWKTEYDMFQEFIYTGSDLTRINYWVDNQKITKLFTKDIIYTDGNPTTVTVKDEITNKTLTTTIAYSETGEVLNVTKSIS